MPGRALSQCFALLCLCLPAAGCTRPTGLCESGADCRSAGRVCCAVNGMCTPAPPMAPPMAMGDMGQSATAALTGLPEGCPPGPSTFLTLYQNVIGPTCIKPGSCHGSVANGHFYADPAMANPSSFIWAQWVNVPSIESPLPRVAVTDLNRSYLMYKLTGQQGKIAYCGLDGAQMPIGATLGPDLLCQFMGWIKAGALP